MKRLFVDLSLTAQTGAGSAVLAWEFAHRLMRLGLPMQVLPMTCPFRTLGRAGLPRKVQALLRDLLWRPFLAGLEAGPRDCFLFINSFVPRRFLDREYGVIMLDLGAWHDRRILSWRGRLGTRSMPAALARARHVFAISEFTARDVCAQFHLPRDRVVLTPCGLSAAFRREAPGDVGRNPPSLPETYLLHVGSLEPKKNIGFLLEVFARLKTTRRPRAGECKLLLTAGEAWRTDAVARSIRDHVHARDIILLGHVPPEDMPGLYRRAAALVFPSTLEGFGLPVIEALSQGTPALIQDNSALSQFKAYGATVFQQFDADQWASALLDVLCRHERVADDHVRAVRAAFDWDASAEIILRAMLGRS